jgi:hypothetical protein
MRTIDITPTWEAAVRIYMMVLEDGTEEGKVMAREDLLRLARNYDALIEDMKGEAAWLSRHGNNERPWSAYGCAGQTSAPIGNCVGMS